MKDKAERSRPNFKDVFGAERTLEDVQEALISQPQLYDYIRQLDEYVDYLDQQSKEEARVVPYQTCPKCDGQGSVSKPPYVPGDVHQWSSTSINFICDVCNGAKIIPMHSGLDD